MLSRQLYDGVGESLDHRGARTLLVVKPESPRELSSALTGRLEISTATTIRHSQPAEHGLLRSSFVPPAPIRELRDLTRHRKVLIQERTRAANRLHALLQNAGIKLASVATDILGVSGRAMLEALVQGTTDPAVLADLARG